MARTKTDEIAAGTEHCVSDEWKAKGRIAGEKLKPDLVWLRYDTGNEWMTVVVDVKITRTEKMNDEFKKKVEKYMKRTTQERMRKKLSRRWWFRAWSHMMDWVRMAQIVLSFNVVIWGKFLNKGSCTSDRRR